MSIGPLFEFPACLSAPVATPSLAVPVASAPPASDAPSEVPGRGLAPPYPSRIDLRKRCPVCKAEPFAFCVGALGHPERR